MEVRWHREGTAHTRSQRVQCLQAFGELNKWKEIHAPQSRITSLGVDCIFMYNIFKDRKLRLQEGKKKNKKKTHCFQKDRRGAQHQHEYRGPRSNSVALPPAKEGICFLSTLQHPNCQIPLATTSKEGIGSAA